MLINGFSKNIFRVWKFKIKPLMIYEGNEIPSIRRKPGYNSAAKEN